MQVTDWEEIIYNEFLELILRSAATWFVKEVFYKASRPTVPDFLQGPLWLGVWSVACSESLNVPSRVSSTPHVNHSRIWPFYLWNIPTNNITVRWDSSCRACPVRLYGVVDKTRNSWNSLCLVVRSVSHGAQFSKTQHKKTLGQYKMSLQHWISYGVEAK